MQTAGSQTGISEAMLRFSHWLVPIGQVPSTGNAETGRVQPGHLHAVDQLDGTQHGAVAAKAARERGMNRLAERLEHHSS